MVGPRRVCGRDHVNDFKENPTRCGNILELEGITRNLIPVKTFTSLEQSAWVGGNPSMMIPKHTHTNVWHWPTHQRLNVGHPDGFVDWLVGLVDADGAFQFHQQKNSSWDFCFKVTASNYNKKLMAYLKKKLQCGSVTSAGKNTCQFQIRNINVLWNFLVPLLKTRQLMTNAKAFEFNQFIKGLSIYNQWTKGLFCEQTRNALLIELKSKPYNQSQMYATWLLHTAPDYQKVPSKGWILGYTEAKGSFYLVKKISNRIVHGAGWIQKDEHQLLEQMRKRWKIKVNLKVHSHNKSWVLDTTAADAVETLIPFFEKKLKGIKAVELRKWARSYRKFKGNFEKLVVLQSQMRKAKKLESG